MFSTSNTYCTLIMTLVIHNKNSRIVVDFFVNLHTFEILGTFWSKTATIKGTGGLRKLRWGLKSKGKRGGLRILYVDFPRFERIYLIGAYKKTVKLDLTKRETEEVRKLIVELTNELKKKNV